MDATVSEAASGQYEYWANCTTQRWPCLAVARTTKQGKTKR